jgi:folate-binding protein YgfZ
MGTGWRPKAPFQAGFEPAIIIGSMTETALQGVPEAAPAPLFSTPLQGAARLADWGLIRATGADAASFLQGQLTADVAGLAVGQATLAGYCSPKGRLLASFIAWRSAPDEFLLACSADVLPATLKRLSMFVLRAKCKLSDAGAELALWGGLGTADAAAAWSARSSGSEHAVRLPDVEGQVRWLIARPADAAPLPPLDPALWQRLEVQSGIVRIVAATADQFVPQMVNFELVGGVNFKKGCYPGQEVVARSQYRGTLKRRSVVVHGAAPLHPAQELFHSGDPGQPAGQVLLGASYGGAHAAFVELKLAAALRLLAHDARARRTGCGGATRLARRPGGRSSGAATAAAGPARAWALDGDGGLRQRCWHRRPAARYADRRG